MKNKSRGSSETLQKFGVVIELPVRLAYPQALEEIKKQIAVQNFTDGFKGSGLQQALRFDSFKNLTGAIVYSLEYKACKNIP